MAFLHILSTFHYLLSRSFLLSLTLPTQLQFPFTSEQLSEVSQVVIYYSFSANERIANAAEEILPFVVTNLQQGHVPLRVSYNVNLIFTHIPSISSLMHCILSNSCSISFDPNHPICIPQRREIDSMEILFAIIGSTSTRMDCKSKIWSYISCSTTTVTITIPQPIRQQIRDRLDLNLDEAPTLLWNHLPMPLPFELQRLREL